MANTLIRPLAYLSIEHGSKRLTSFNWTLPIAMAIVLTGLGAWLTPSLNVFHTGGVVERLLGFVQSFPAFI